jgi:AraC family transcriptional regulator, regulatory protein of adaptative response / DNA-3-methyladenine glycosylase II
VTEAVSSSVVRVRLKYREPFAAGHLLAFLAARAVHGVEESSTDGYVRVVRTPHGPAVAELSPKRGYVAARIRLPDVADLDCVVAGLRRLFDVDADPAAVDGALSREPALRNLVATAPGIRVPGAVDGFELAIRAVLGQQVSLAAARTFASRLVEECGTPLAEPVGSLTAAFPTAQAVAGAALGGLGLTGARVTTVRTLAERVASGAVQLEPGADPAGARSQLLAVPGIGPWTVEYIAMRAFADPDAWPSSDLVLRRRIDALGLDRSASTLRPWRAYGAMHLWQSDNADAPE